LFCNCEQNHERIMNEIVDKIDIITSFVLKCGSLC